MLGFLSVCVPIEVGEYLQSAIAYVYIYELVWQFDYPFPRDIDFDMSTPFLQVLQHCWYLGLSYYISNGSG